MLASKRYDSSTIPDELVSRVREIAGLVLAKHGGACQPVFVVVEGTTDVGLYGRLLAPNPYCHVMTFAPSVDDRKGQVLRRVPSIQRLQIPCVGIVDADCDRLLGATAHYPHGVFVTDGHDSEMMALAPEGMAERLLARLERRPKYRERGLRGLVQNAGGPRSLVESWVRASAPIGQMMLLRAKGQIRGSLGVKTDQLDSRFPGFVEVQGSTVTVRVDRLLTATLKRAQPHLSPEASASISDELEAAKHSDVIELTDVCRGHDVAAVGAVHLSRALRMRVNRQDLEDELRKAYTNGEDFKRTALHDAIRSWEASAAGICLLPNGVPEESPLRPVHIDARILAEHAAAAAHQARSSLAVALPEASAAAQGREVGPGDEEPTLPLQAVGARLEVRVTEMGPRYVIAQTAQGSRVEIDKVRLALTDFGSQVRVGVWIAGIVTSATVDCVQLLPEVLLDRSK